MCGGPVVEEKLAGGTCLEKVWSLQTGTCGLDQRRLHCYRLLAMREAFLYVGLKRVLD